MIQSTHAMQPEPGFTTARRPGDAAAIDQLIQDALAYNTPQQLSALFQFSRKLPHYSPFNCLLLPNTSLRSRHFAITLRIRFDWPARARARTGEGARAPGTSLRFNSITEPITHLHCFP